jgi:hypothetical protein
LLVLLTPPAIELDFIPVIGRLDGLLVGYLSLELFIWLCPPRDFTVGSTKDEVLAIQRAPDSFGEVFSSTVSRWSISRMDA